MATTRAKQRPFAISKLPHRVFISYAYEDEASKDALVARLHAADIEGLPFPPRTADPKTAVSDSIVAQIRSCGALIYLEGGRSEDSLWVNFERDYALRSGLRVYSFDAKDRKLREQLKAPIPLHFTLLVGEDRESRAGRLLKWLKEDRSFVFDAAPTRVKMKEIGMLVAGLISDGSPILWLLDGDLRATAELALELEPIDVAHYCSDLPEYRDGGRPASGWDGYASWLNENSIYARLYPDWRPTSDPDALEYYAEQFPIAVDNMFRQGWAVDLVSGGDEAQIDWNRADDLIVRLTFLLQRSRPFLQPDEDE